MRWSILARAPSGAAYFGICVFLLLLPFGNARRVSFLALSAGASKAAATAASQVAKSRVTQLPALPPILLDALPSDFVSNVYNTITATAAAVPK